MNLHYTFGIFMTWFETRYLFNIKPKKLQFNVKQIY